MNIFIAYSPKITKNFQRRVQNYFHQGQIQILRGLKYFHQQQNCAWWARKEFYPRQELEAVYLHITKEASFGPHESFFHKGQIHTIWNIIRRICPTGHGSIHLWQLLTKKSNHFKKQISSITCQLCIGIGTWLNPDQSKK